eukprot:4579329-Prymnesium_polylepis.1
MRKAIQHLASQRRAALVRGAAIGLSPALDRAARARGPARVAHEDTRIRGAAEAVVLELGLHAVGAFGARVRQEDVRLVPQQARVEVVGTGDRAGRTVNCAVEVHEEAVDVFERPRVGRVAFDQAA